MPFKHFMHTKVHKNRERRLLAHAHKSQRNKTQKANWSTRIQPAKPQRRPSLIVVSYSYAHVVRHDQCRQQQEHYHHYHHHRMAIKNRIAKFHFTYNSPTRIDPRRRWVFAHRFSYSSFFQLWTMCAKTAAKSKPGIEIIYTACEQRCRVWPIEPWIKIQRMRCGLLSK